MCDRPFWGVTANMPTILGAIDVKAFMGREGS
jgi:hypothetical protein